MTLQQFTLCKEPTCRRKGTHDEEVLSVFQGIMPPGYKYMICSCARQSTTAQTVAVFESRGFEAHFRINTTSKEEFLKWKEDFHESSLTTLRVRRTTPTEGERVLYNVEFRCQHNTLPRSSTADSRVSSKNTHCEASASVTVYNSLMKKRSLSTSKDPHLHSYQTYVHLRFIHNHPINVADALRHRDVSDETMKRLEELLLSGYRPAAALNLFKYDLQTEDPESYIFNSADRSKCPDKQYVYRLSYKLFAQHYGHSKSKDQLGTLKSFIASINAYAEKESEGSSQHAASATVTEQTVCKEAEHASPSSEQSVAECLRPAQKSSDVVRMEVTEDNQLVIAICTPMMQRVHQFIRHSGELMFCDASGNMDRDQCRVFVLLTHSVVGGLPLGILIVTSESQKTITSALTLYNSLLDNRAFYGRGKAGPAVVMTDDAKSERQALTFIYPNATLLLCAFHVLQSFWRYLWDSKNCVLRSERQHLFSLLKDMLYSSSEEVLINNFEKTEQDETVQKHTNVKKYLTNLFKRKNEWAVCCRKDLPMRGNNTNNYCESAMRVLKDQVLHRTKAFNVQQLLDFVFKRMETYYQRRCMDVANNRVQDLQHTKHRLSSKKSADRPLITRYSAHHFEAKSLTDPTKTYTIDMDAGFCTCHMGLTGGPCKHQEEVVRQYKVPSWNFLPDCDVSMRHLLNKVATGKDVSALWFQSLQSLPEQLPASDAEVTSGSEIVFYTDPCAAFLSMAGDQPCGSSSTREDIATRATSDSEEEFDFSAEDSSLMRRFDRMVGDIRKKITDDKAAFREPLSKMLNSFDNIKTDSNLASAMACFGKYTGVSLVSSKHIGVQPAAKQRRVITGFNHSARVGRPATSGASASSTSSSSKRKQELPLSGVSLPRKKAKHSLKECVQSNCSLGKTHSAK